MRALVTGAAGFLGSHLTDTLLSGDCDVVAIDRFSDNYPESLKHSNLTGAIGNPRFSLHEADVNEIDLVEVLEEVDVVFHLAAQAGVRGSWGSHFVTYQRDNVSATQRLLEAVAGSTRRPRVVYSSSSSIYGNAARYPSTELDRPEPASPYGVTKLSAEQLCHVYAENLGVHTVSLRYFTLYGPRQRPDMAFHRLFAAGLGGPPFRLFGNGSQVRDFTYVGDAVAANIAAATRDVEPGSVFNVAGGSEISILEVIDRIGDLIGAAVPVVEEDVKPGDVRRTGGSSDRARAELGWKPTVALDEGLTRQLDHHRRVILQVAPFRSLSGSGRSPVQGSDETSRLEDGEDGQRALLG